jgi:hypothetical protein
MACSGNVAAEPAGGGVVGGQPVEAVAAELEAARRPAVVVAAAQPAEAVEGRLVVAVAAEGVAGVRARRIIIVAELQIARRSCHDECHATWSGFYSGREARSIR